MATTIVKQQRIYSLDSLRGVLVLSMILYHGTWDLVYLFGVPQPWFTGGLGHWQQLITCSSFIFLSGYCIPLSRHLWRRGATVFGLGLAITVVTVVFTPDTRVVFGILTLLGSCMLLTAAVKPWLCQIPPKMGLAICMVVFLLLRHMSAGVIALGSWTLCSVPDWLYQNLLSGYLGFPAPGFFSTDYFPLLPWLPMFWAGYFLAALYRLPATQHPHPLTAPLRFIGRHALEIYVIHQPIVYVLLWLVFYF